MTKELSADKVFKGVTDVHDRLLDHKPVIQAEVKFFVKEFETKRNNEDRGQLERSLGEVRETQTVHLPEVMELMETQLPEALIQLHAASDLCGRITQKEEERLQADPLFDRRQQREKRRTDYREQLAKERDMVDVEHRSRMTAVENHFEEHTRKLTSGD